MTMKNVCAISLMTILFLVGCKEKDESITAEQKNTEKCNCLYQNIRIDTIQWGKANLESILGEWIFEAAIDTADCEAYTAENIPEMTLKFLKNNHVSGNMIEGIYYQPNDEQNPTPIDEDSYNQYTFVDGEIVFSKTILSNAFNPAVYSKISLSDTCKVFVTKDKLFLFSNEILAFSKNPHTVVSKPISLLGTWREIIGGQEVAKLTVSDNDTIYYQSGNTTSKYTYNQITEDTIQIERLSEKEDALFTRKTNCPIVVHSNDCISIKRFHISDASVFPPMFKEILLFRDKK